MAVFTLCFLLQASHFFMRLLVAATANLAVDHFPCKAEFVKVLYYYYSSTDMKSHDY